MEHDAFISHSSKDKSIAIAVCSILEQNKIKCWVAPRDIIPGKSYPVSITEAIKLSKFLVVIFSSSSNSSEPVMNEVELAMKNGLVIIPFRIENIVPSEGLEFFLSSKHWLDAINPPIEQHINRLAETILTFKNKNTSKIDIQKPKEKLSWDDMLSASRKQIEINDKISQTEKKCYVTKISGDNNGIVNNGSGIIKNYK